MMKRLSTVLALILILGACKKDDTSSPKGKRITKVVFESIAWTDGNGRAWDADGTGPDLILYYGPSGAVTHHAGEFSNVTQAALPLTADLAAEKNTADITDQEWQFTLKDVDYESATEETMTSWVFNPAAYASPIRLQSKDGKTYNIAIYYEGE